MKSKPKGAGRATPHPELIDQKIAEFGDSRPDVISLARMRGLIKEADPDVVEEWKWMGTPVSYHHWRHVRGRMRCKAMVEADVTSRARR